MANEELQPQVTETNEKQHVALIEDVEFLGMSCTLKAKMDTGATMCSIHATDVKTLENGMVTFICPLSDNTLQAHSVGTQTVHTSDSDGENRAIVEFDIKIGEVVIKKAQFNLNDRSNMDTPVLIGQNVLEQGFIVDVASEGDENLHAAEEPIDNTSDSGYGDDVAEPKDYAGMTSEDWKEVKAIMQTLIQESIAIYKAKQKDSK